MMVVCKDRLERLRANVRMGPDALDANAAVETEISTLLSGKTYEQLVALQRQVQTKLQSGEPLDTDYWEGLLKSLLVWKAKVRTFSLHMTSFIVTKFPFHVGETEESSRDCCAKSFGAAS